MKRDIRELLRSDILPKKKLPNSHREEFLRKLQEVPIENSNRKKFYVRVKVAASIAILATIAVFFVKKEDAVISPSANEIIALPIDSILTNSDMLTKTKENISTKNKEKQKKVTLNFRNEIKKSNNAPKKPLTQNIAFDKKNTIIKESIMQDETKLDTIISSQNITNKNITVNSDALLFSITHSGKEVLAFYKENNLVRESVLASMEYKLNKYNVDVDADELLKDIELGIGKNSFKEKLLEAINLKIKELSNTIAIN